MEHFTGNILAGNQVLLEDVEGLLFINKSPAGWATWNGTFELPVGKNIDFDGPDHLQLADGRSGKIFITRKQPNGSGITVVEFQGSGPLE